MTLPKKNSRIINVGEESYRWVANGNDHGIDIYVVLEDGTGQLLYGIADYEFKDKKQLPVSPVHIKAIIELGLSLGWEPAAKKPRLKIEETIKLG